jgi:hypothetical protein
MSLYDVHQKLWNGKDVMAMGKLVVVGTVLHFLVSKRAKALPLKIEASWDKRSNRAYTIATTSAKAIRAAAVTISRDEVDSPPSRWKCSAVCEINLSSPVVPRSS